MNADDLGATESVNAGILDAHRRGVVTSASFMANMPASAEGAGCALDAPDLDVGLHVNLTEGRPLTTARSLVSRDGVFRRLPAQIVALSCGLAREGDVVAEIRAQWERARALGLFPTHVDGHEHIHLFGAARRAVFALAARERLAIRRPRVMPLSARRRSAFFSIRDLLLRRGARGGEWDVCRHADALLDLTTALPHVGPAALADRIAAAGGFVELMCHPGRRQDAADSDPLREHRPRDLEFLVAPGLRDALAHAGVRLSSFRELGGTA